jgi:predicted secreted protein
MPIQNNLVPDWEFSTHAGTGATCDWTGWVETRTAGGGVTKVEETSVQVRFGAHAANLSTTNNAGVGSLVSAAYIAVDRAKHYVLRFNHWKVSGANSLKVIVTQYNAASADLGAPFTVTPAGAASWGLSTKVIHPNGEGGDAWAATVTKVKLTITVDTTVADWYVDGISFAPAETPARASFGTNIFATGYELAELTTISGPNATADTIEATSHNSDDWFREFIAGVKDGGEITLEGNAIFDPATSKHEERLTDLTLGTQRLFYVIFPSAIAEWTFYGNVTAFTTEAPYDDKLPISFTVKVTGKPVLTTASFA